MGRVRNTAFLGRALLTPKGTSKATLEQLMIS